MQRTILAPQPGPQTAFLSSTADFVIYGGAAGGGKTYSLLLEPLRHKDNPLFYGVIFRRTSPQITNPGALWDEAESVYPMTGAAPVKSDTRFEWDKGMKLAFRHMEHEKNKLDWQGAQVGYVGFDEITHFSESMVTYMFSRGRGKSGVDAYFRGTCNPDPDSWVRRWIDWWIGPDGLPIPERSGVIRWFIRIGDEMIWADSKQELIDKHQEFPVTEENRIIPMSFTFIPATIYDNKILLRTNPKYLAQLKGMPRVEREKLLGGNWNVRAQIGSYYKREWIKEVHTVHPSSVFVRFWDRAATEPNESNKDPDWTAGVKMARQPRGISPRYVICNVERDRLRPAGVLRLIEKTAERDGRKVRIGIEQEPGSSGKADATATASELIEKGFEVRKRRPTGDKKDRYMPFSAECENGEVGILPGPWNDAFHSENENCVFDDLSKDDQCDAASGAFNELQQKMAVPEDMTVDADFGRTGNQWSAVDQ